MAECDCWEVGKPKWRTSIFMPRWASRLTLEVESIRVERLHDISEEDAQAEGVQVACEGRENGNGRMLLENSCYKLGYRLAWDSLNKKRGLGWGMNPWVWVVEFRRLSEGL